VRIAICALAVERHPGVGRFEHPVEDVPGRDRRSGFLPDGLDGLHSGVRLLPALGNDRGEVRVLHRSYDAWHGEGIGEVDLFEDGVKRGRANDLAVDHALDLNVDTVDLLARGLRGQIYARD